MRISLVVFQDASSGTAEARPRFLKGQPRRIRSVGLMIFKLKARNDSMRENYVERSLCSQATARW